MSARAIFFAALLAITHSALAQVDNPELRKATLEATAGQALYELGQMRASMVQLNQQIEALKAKCGEACKFGEPAAVPK